jgi:S-adenosylmethionine:tRNA ribosyltransferase-isomerase
MMPEFNTRQSMSVTAIQHSLATSELDYELPPGLIATRPAEPRDSARLMVLRRSSEQIDHLYVRDLPNLLQKGDALVFNTTAVAPARLVGHRVSTSGKVEGLYLHDELPSEGKLRWRVMLHAGGKLHPGDRIVFEAETEAARCEIELQQKIGTEWIASVHGEVNSNRALNHVGRTPLPPYILKARGGDRIGDEQDRDWYQTVYADRSHEKSVAAPTAGLHFTAEGLRSLAERGVKRIAITLDVGSGTFKPVTAATLAEHHMHEEQYEVSAQAVEAIAALRRGRLDSYGGRIVAVGTTSVRTLESIDWQSIDAGRTANAYSGIRGTTDLLIAPTFKFQCVDGILTNFHLPQSTLLALVAAMVGLDRLRSIYRMAIDKGYRFYSYGDAMLILP